MNKRLGFRPQYIRSNREHIVNQRITRSKEGFDMKRKTSSNKIYVITDKTGSYAIGYDSSDTSNSAPLIIKPLDLHDKTQWITINADVGIFNFFYSTQPHLIVDITPNDEGLRVCRRSDIFKNGYFKFGDTENTIIFLEPSNTSEDGSNDYCLAFQKAKAVAAEQKLADQLTAWNKRYSFYNNDTNTDPVETKESFGRRRGNVRERYDSNTCYLEIVKRKSLDTDKYSYEWELQEIWDQRTSTNVALESEQIKDLESIDANAVANAGLLVNAIKTKYDQLDTEYKNNLTLVNSHFIGGMWL